MSLIALLETVAVFGLVAYLLFWLMNYLGVPEPIRKVAVVVIVLIAAIWILNNFLPVGQGHLWTR